MTLLAQRILRYASQFEMVRFATLKRQFTYYCKVSYLEKTLQKMVKDGKLVRVSRGRYKA